MSKVVDIFTKKEIKVEAPITKTTAEVDLIEYDNRQKKCLNYIMTNNSPCNCVYCFSKDLLAKRVALDIVQTVREFNSKAAIKLNIYDILDISVKSSLELEDRVSRLI